MTRKAFKDYCQKEKMIEVSSKIKLYQLSSEDFQEEDEEVQKIVSNQLIFVDPTISVLNSGISSKSPDDPIAKIEFGKRRNIEKVLKAQIS